MSNYSNDVLNRTLDNLDVKGTVKDICHRMNVQLLEYERMKSATGLLLESLERREKKQMAEQPSGPRCIAQDNDMRHVTKKIWDEITSEKYVGFSDMYEQQVAMLTGIMGCLYPNATLDALGPIIEVAQRPADSTTKRRRVEGEE